jgi:hypothetical protein
MGFNVRDALASAGLSLIVEPKKKQEQEHTTHKNGSMPKDRHSKRATARTAKQH